ncbi:acyltransferase family protein [Prosthecobacter sp.]|uniref:acyltransferase family protein n=1 Tax=Prosthecobacter sp. TaxID=1965333 RepID=UPI003783F532
MHPPIPSRFPQIDILRSVAVLLVLGRHMTECPETTSTWLHDITHVWWQGGWAGVDLFFVLSGFLVSGLLFSEYEKYRQLRIGRFLIRRGFKIYPPFWLLIGVTFVGRFVRHSSEPLWAELLSELAFVQNYGPSLWNYTWSLAVEEHFYLLLAFGFFLLCKRRAGHAFSSIPAAFLVAAMVCLTLRLLGTHAAYDNKTHLFPTHLRLDSLFFGVLLSFLFHRHPASFLAFAKRFRHGLLGAGVLLLSPAFCLPLETTPFIYTYGLTLFYIGGGCLLVSALGSPASVSGFGRAMACIGSHSYSIYLWHMPVAILGASPLARRFQEDLRWPVYAILYLGGAILFGMTMSILIESPVLRLRNRLFPSRSGAPG